MTASTARSRAQIISPFPAAAAAVADELAAMAERLSPSIVQIGQKGGGNGAGVIWRPDGIIVTNRHVVREDRVDVWTHAGEHHVGIVAARHPERDLAVIKIAADGLPAADPGDSSTVRPGAITFAIGHPVGYRLSLSLGIVTASGQAATGEGPRTGDWIQTDVTLLPGNSGGPLFDAHGRVIGINTMVQGDLSLAVPSVAVEHFVAGERPGAVRGYIGINGQVVALRRPDFSSGFLVSEVAEGAPAERSGLIVGDVVVGVSNLPVADEETLPASLMRLKAGDAVVLDVLRGGAPRQFTVVPTERQ
ncbi:MAG: S1C family serine protease [Thermomicrobiales bacterium]